MCVIPRAAAADGGGRRRAGALVEYRRAPWAEPPAAVGELRVLHADDALVVLSKPSGLPVLPSELYYEHTVLRLLARAWPEGGAPHPARAERKETQEKGDDASSKFERRSFCCRDRHIAPSAQACGGTRACLSAGRSRP